MHDAFTASMTVVGCALIDRLAVHAHPSDDANTDSLFNAGNQVLSWHTCTAILTAVTCTDTCRKDVRITQSGGRSDLVVVVALAVSGAVALSVETVSVAASGWDGNFTADSLPAGGTLTPARTAIRNFSSGRLLKLSTIEIFCHPGYVIFSYCYTDAFTMYLEGTPKAYVAIDREMPGSHFFSL